MIIIKQCEDENNKMDVFIKGNAEDVANEYAALTFWLKNKYKHIYDRAMDAVEYDLKML